MLFRNPQLFAFVLIAAGLGLLSWYGEQWYRLPVWTEAETEQSVELNLAIELARMGPHLRPQGEKLELLRGMIRDDVRSEIQRERSELERWLGAGLLLLVFGLGQWLAAIGLKK